jgi:hypothetical protein
VEQRATPRRGGFLTEPASGKGFHDLEHLPGVIRAEPVRSVPARLRYGHRQRKLSVTGISKGADLNRLLDANERPIEMPEEGLLMSEKLAEILGARIGDEVQVEMLEGRRRVVDVPIRGLVTDFAGVAAYMDITALQRILKEGNTVNGAYLAVDHKHWDRFMRAVKDTPRAAFVMVKRDQLAAFRETTGKSIGIIRKLYFALATIVAFGVVYNSARIALSERSRELATLRVVGFSLPEVRAVLVGELAVLVLLACPPACFSAAAWRCTHHGLLQHRDRAPADPDQPLDLCHRRGRRAHRRHLLLRPGLPRCWRNSIPRPRRRAQGARSETGKDDPWARQVKGLLCAHIDSKYYKDKHFLGADDAASACAAIVVIAQHLAREKPEQAAALELVFFDGEEAFNENITPQDGLYGSRHYANQWRSRDDKPAFGILLDMIGHENLSIRLPSDTPPDLKESVFAAAKKEGAEQYFGMAPGPIIDDHVPLNFAGIPTVDIIGDFTRSGWWHTPGDNMKIISADSLDISIRVTLRMLDERLGK